MNDKYIGQTLSKQNAWLQSNSIHDNNFACFSDRQILLYAVFTKLHIWQANRKDHCFPFSHPQHVHHHPRSLFPHYHVHSSYLLLRAPVVLTVEQQQQY